MDYKEKYNNALEWLRGIYPTLTGAAKEDAEHFFPELAGSEDERIRKELIEYLTHRAEVTGFIAEDKDCKRWIAYLEKQKEQKIARWKPSEEQMKALEHCVNGWQDTADGTLESLYNDLKKLL